MWPILLDMSKEESMQHLRCLEIDAFSGLVNALRAQGTLSNEKLKLLKETGTMLHISQERHKAEIRRVVNDERLNTIAYYVNGERHSIDEWADEGQRLIPLIPRIAPQTAYSAIADDVADSASKLNKQLPLPASTERKRPCTSSPTQLIVNNHPSTSEISNKNTLQFRLNETDIKKRKLNMENCGSAPLRMAPPKISKIQQIYRQKTRAKFKEQMVKLKPPENEKEIEGGKCAILQQSQPQLIQQVVSKPQIKVLNNQTIKAIPPPSVASTPAVDSMEENAENIAKITPANEGKNSSLENLASKRTITSSLNDVKQAGKVNTPTLRALPSKTITTADGQKLIVVSTIPHTQPTQTTSILQRTLTTLPFKNISLKNLDKFKFVATSGGAQQHSSKQKIVTVRNAPNKKIIPLSQVQVVNTKAGIKVLPLSNKTQTRYSNVNAGGFVDNGSKQDEPVTCSSGTAEKPTNSLKRTECTSNDFPLGMRKVVDNVKINGVINTMCSRINYDGLHVGDDAQEINCAEVINGKSTIEEHIQVVPISNSNAVIDSTDFCEKLCNDVFAKANSEECANETSNHDLDILNSTNSNKMDLEENSALYIYGNEANANVTMDSIEDQPTVEVLNAIQTLDEPGYSNMKNIRS